MMRILTSLASESDDMFNELQALLGRDGELREVMMVAHIDTRPGDVFGYEDTIPRRQDTTRGRDEIKEVAWHHDSTQL